MLSNLIKSWQLYFILQQKNPQKLQEYMQKKAFAFWGVAQKIFPEYSFCPPLLEQEYLAEVFKDEIGQELNSLFTSIDTNPLSSNYLFTDFAGITAEGNNVIIRVNNPQIFNDLDSELGLLYYIKGKSVFSFCRLFVAEEIKLIEYYADLRIVGAAIENANDGHQVDWEKSGKNVLVYTKTGIIYDDLTNVVVEPKLTEISMPFLSENTVQNILTSDSPGKRFERKNRRR